MKWLRLNITRKFLLLLFGFLVLQLVQLGISEYGVLHVGTEGAMINNAGKQRMRTLLIGNLARAALAPNASGANDRRRLALVIAEYEKGFVALEAYLSRPHYVGSLVGMVREAHATWRDQLQPLIRQVDRTRPQAAQATLAHYDALSIAQVARLDRIVETLEDNIRQDARRLAILQTMIVGLSLLLGAIGVVMARIVITRPLQRFIEATRAIAAGAYDRRVETRAHDELGELMRTFNRMAAAVGEKTARLHALNEIALVVTSPLSPHELLDKIMLYGMPLSAARGVVIAFYDDTTQQLQNWVTRGLSENFVAALEFPAGSVADQAVRRGDYVLSNDLPGTAHPLLPREREEGIHSLICLPLAIGERRLGAMIFYRGDREDFEFEEIQLLMTFARLAAHAIQNARLRATTADLAEHDPLTGLYNRRMFEQRLHEEILRTQRSYKPFALLLLDIDHFKNVNDIYGHAAGDAVLKMLATVFMREIRDIDLVARVGGEEFMFVLPETDGEGARLVAERIRQAIAAQTVTLANAMQLNVTASLGIACYPETADSAEALLTNADRALYAAKEGGRNRTVVYSRSQKVAGDSLVSAVELIKKSLDHMPAFMTAADQKTEFAHRHSECTQRYALLIGRALGFSEHELVTLQRAAQLHDIGTVAVPDEVMNKSTPLTPLEWGQIRQHAVVGAEILSAVPTLVEVAPIVRAHHERYDGGGYPEGLSGEAIPRLARVLAVADTYCALCSDRPYRHELTPEQARAVIVAGAGVQFDPAIVEAFVRMLDETLAKS